MAKGTFLREIELKGQFLSGVGGESAVHRLDVLCQFQGERALRDLVEHGELTLDWRDIGHDHLASVGLVDQELVWHCLLLIIGVSSDVSVSD